MSTSLQDKVVVVTGAGTGVGRGIVAGFCADGAHVVGISRTESELKETAEKHGRGRFNYVVGDVSKGADVERLFTEAERLYGRVDILVNNAAVYPKVLFLDQSPDDFEKALLINVMGVARCAHRALPGMLKRGYGRIINIGSYAFKAPFPTAVVYSASKGAVSSLSLGISTEVDPAKYPDVLVNELMPGVFQTRMTPDHGDDPMSGYAYVKNVALLPAGGPHGRIFLKDQLIDEGAGGVKGKLKRVFGRLTGG